MDATTRSVKLAILLLCPLATACATPPVAECATVPTDGDGSSAGSVVADAAEGDEAEDADTSAVELIVCHPESIHDYANEAAAAAGSEAKFACSLYDRAGVIALLESDVAGTEFASLTEALGHEHNEGTAEYIYIYDQATLEWLSDDDRSGLTAAFRSGAPVGLGGTNEAALTSALGLPEGQAGVLPESRSAHFVHLDGDSVEHLAVELPYQDSFGQVLGEVMDWEETNHRYSSSVSVAPSASRDAGANAVFGYVAPGTQWEFPTSAIQSSVSVADGWHYCKSYTYSGKIANDDNDVGGYNMKFSFYYVTREEVADKLDRWLVVSELTSSMSSYYTENGNSHKGWYMRAMQLKATLGQYTGDIDEWSPSTTVGSSSTSSSIGTGISASGPSADYGVSTTNSTQDVEIKVDGDLSNDDGVNGADWAQWTVEFDRCGSNNADTKLTQPAAAAQGIWKEELALYTVNEDDGEGVKVMLAPYFRVEHCRCGTSHCPIRSSTTHYPFGTTGSTFQVFEDTCN